MPHQPGEITKRAVWFVTGCSTGFGRELATQLLRQDSRVVVTARDLADFKDARDAPNPPHRLLLGNQAFDGAIAKLAALQEEFVAWEAVSRGADFPTDEAA